MLSYHFLCICLLLAILITSDASFLKPHSSILRSFHKYCKTVAVGAVFLHPFQSVHAARMIGEIPTSGFIFKDTLKVQEFEDPKIKGVAIYLADFDRPINEKLTSNFFNDPSSSSLSCSKIGPITVSPDVNTSNQGEDVFEESKNLFFKSIHVRRIFDKKTNTIVYASYNTRFNTGDDENKSRFKSSLCAVHIE